MFHMEQKSDNFELKIILFLTQKRAHIRGIAKELNLTHTTILRKVNQLFKENVVDFEYEGKNKVFYLKKNQISKSYVLRAELYKVSLIINKYPFLEVIINDILKISKEKMLILFGSYAEFRAEKNSDVDIYIESTDRNLKKKIESINSKLSIKIGLFDEQSPLIREIIKKHIILRGLEEFYEKIKFFG